jgi:hypothetical protein
VQGEPWTLSKNNIVSSNGAALHQRLLEVLREAQQR